MNIPAKYGLIWYSTSPGIAQEGRPGNPRHPARCDERGAAVGTAATAAAAPAASAAVAGGGQRLGT